jgi:hypothetical protein
LGILATLVAVFYTEEDWRGKRDWDNCRRELEAKGEVFDWSAFIPAPVPDDQNMYKAPKMEGWFVTKNFFGDRFVKQTNAAPPPASAFGGGSSGPVALSNASPVLLCELAVLAPGASTPAEPADSVLRMDDSGAPARFRQQVLGDCLAGATGCLLLGRPLDQSRPRRLSLRAGTTPSAKELSAFLLSGAGADNLRVELAAPDLFRVWLRVWLPRTYLASDYLAWSDQFQTNLDLVRKGLERPLARIDCSYEVPYGMDIPHFVNPRTVVQALGQRAQCFLLLGQPEPALRELTLSHDLCRLLNTRPMTLVAAMINVAATGLYASIVEDGLRLHAWREPQLLALEQQLRDVDLFSPFLDSLKTEQAATHRTLEITPPRKLADLFAASQSDVSLVERIKNGTALLPLIPRGWIYQNEAKGSPLHHQFRLNIDPTNRLIRPQAMEDVFKRLAGTGDYFWPYTFLIRRAFPNYLKAATTVARNQTQVNEALLACALERYRLAHQEYPETLAALAPQFVDVLPHDLIGGQPLKYRRMVDGSFLLYSIGWNEKDDGGIAGKSREEGDWVWR